MCRVSCLISLTETVSTCIAHARIVVRVAHAVGGVLELTKMTEKHVGEGGDGCVVDLASKTQTKEKSKEDGGEREEGRERRRPSSFLILCWNSLGREKPFIRS
jgi:hypothetical protein